MDLGFCDSFGGLTRELSDLGFRHCAFVYMSLVVGGMYWRLSAKRRAHQGRSLGFKSLGATTMDVLVLIRKL